MISPPVNRGGVHVKARVDLVLKIVFSFNSVGGSGEVVITAPFPSRDSTESPYALVAVTVAYTLEPQGRLNGYYLSDKTGIVQEAADGDEVTSQSIRSGENVILSLSLNKTSNPVIGEPPESGIVQLTITSSGIQVVITLVG
jgi:hypothetical protein